MTKIRHEAEETYACDRSDLPEDPEMICAGCGQPASEHKIAMQPTVPAHVVRLAMDAVWPEEGAPISQKVRARIISAALEAAFPHIAAQVLRGISEDMNCKDDYELCRDTADELLGAD